MQLVEVVRAPLTSDEAIERAFEFASAIGKTAVLAADTPGFIVNRVARPYYLQSLRALERGVASARRARRAGARRRLSHGAVRTDGSHRARRESGDDRVGLRAHAGAALGSRRAAAADGCARDCSGARPARASTSIATGDARAIRARRHEPETGEPNDEESVVILGFGGLADDARRRRRAALRARRPHRERRDCSASCSATRRSSSTSATARPIAATRSRELDAMLGPRRVFFVDAYATDLAACARRLRHPERLIGYGILGSLRAQRAVEIVDSEEVVRRRARARARTVREPRQRRRFGGRRARAVPRAHRRLDRQRGHDRRARARRVTRRRRHGDAARRELSERADRLGPRNRRRARVAHIASVSRKPKARRLLRTARCGCSTSRKPRAGTPESEAGNEPRGLGDRRGANADRPLRRPARERAPRRPSRCRAAGRRRANGVAPAAIDESISARPIKAARTIATSRAWRCSWRTCRSRFRAPRSTGSAARAFRRSTRRRRRSPSARATS